MKKKTYFIRETHCTNVQSCWITSLVFFLNCNMYMIPCIVMERLNANKS